MESEKRTQLLELLVKEAGYKGDVANIFDPNTPYVNLSLHFCANLKMLEDFKAIWEAKRYLLHVAPATLLEIINACENDEELRSCMDFLLEKNAFEGGMIENFVQRLNYENRAIFCLWALEKADILKLDMARLTMTEVTPAMLEPKNLTKEWAKYVMPATFSRETRAWIAQKFFPHAEFKLNPSFMKEMLLETYDRRVVFSLIGYNLEAMDLYLSRFATKAKKDISLLDLMTECKETWAHVDYFHCLQSHLQFTKEEVLANDAEVFKMATSSPVLVKWLLNTFDFTEEELDVDSLLQLPECGIKQATMLKNHFRLPECLKPFVADLGASSLETLEGRGSWLDEVCRRKPCNREAVITVLKQGFVYENTLRRHIGTFLQNSDLEMLELFYTNLQEKDISVFVQPSNLYCQPTVDWVCSRFTLTKDSFDRMPKFYLEFAVKLLQLKVFTPDEIMLESHTLLTENEELLKEFFHLMQDASPDKKKQIITSLNMRRFIYHTECHFNILAHVHDFCPFSRDVMVTAARECIQIGDAKTLDWLLATFDFELWEIYTDKIHLKVITVLKKHVFLEVMYNMTRTLGECYNDSRLQWAKNVIASTLGSFNYLKYLVNNYGIDIKDDTIYTALLESIDDIYRNQRRAALDKVFERDNFVERMTANLKQAGDQLKMKDVSLTSLMSFLEQFNAYKTALEETGRDVEQEKKLEALFESIVQHQ